MSADSNFCGAQEEKPDLIILDVKLPDLNGFEICQRLKSNPNTADIPVVFLSSQHDPADGKRRAFFMGATEFLSYPIQPEQLTVIVNAVLAKRKAQSSCVAPCFRSASQTLAILLLQFTLRDRGTSRRGRIGNIFTVGTW